MAKRRKRKRSNGASWLMIVALALLIAGFMARRLMMPPAARYLAPRAEDYPSAPPASAGSQADNAHAAHTQTNSDDNGSGEHLSDSDRRALDEVIRRKTEAH
jgi:hypothetical protein